MSEPADHEALAPLQEAFSRLRGEIEAFLKWCEAQCDRIREEIDDAEKNGTPDDVKERHKRAAKICAGLNAGVSGFWPLMSPWIGEYSEAAGAFDRADVLEQTGHALMEQLDMTLGLVKRDAERRARRG